MVASAPIVAKEDFNRENFFKNFKPAEIFFDSVETHMNERERSHPNDEN